MTITRAQCEVILTRRRGLVMTRIGLDGTTTSGANLDLGDPIAFAIRQLGYGVTDPTNPADADLAPVDQTTIDELLDVAEWRVLLSCLGNAARVTQQGGTDKIDYTDLITELRQQFKDLTDSLKLAYGLGLQSLTAGVIDLGFQATDDAEALAQIFN